MSTQHHSDDTTHFGFRTVNAAEKQGMVRDVFDSVASKYDIMNDLMSGGVHRLWKARMIDWLNPRPGQRFLDVAGGTGDIAFRILDRANARLQHDAKSRDEGHADPAQVTVCDINQEMLKVGRARALDAGRVSGLDWVCGNAESLPFPDAHFDAYTIAFGIRNVTYIDKALREARRVLKPGGRFLCLEFSKVVVPGMDEIYDVYSFTLLPKIGKLVAKDEESYRYLAESIRKFPNQDTFAAMIRDAGLGSVKVRNLSGGIAALHSAWRI